MTIGHSGTLGVNGEDKWRLRCERSLLFSL